MDLKAIQKQTIEDLNDQGRLSEVELTYKEDFHLWFDCKSKDVQEFKALFFMLGIRPEGISSANSYENVTFFFDESSF